MQLLLIDDDWCDASTFANAWLSAARGLPELPALSISIFTSCPALEVLAEYDGVSLDVYLGAEDGATYARTAAARYPALPLMLLSGVEPDAGERLSPSIRRIDKNQIRLAVAPMRAFLRRMATHHQLTQGKTEYA